MKSDLNTAIRKQTCYAFAAIGLMLLVFLLIIVLSTVPLGIPLSTLNTVVIALIYLLGGLAAVGAFFSMRVTHLRKQLNKYSEKT